MGILPEEAAVSVHRSAFYAQIIDRQRLKIVLKLWKTWGTDVCSTRIIPADQRWQKQLVAKKAGRGSQYFSAICTVACCHLGSWVSPLPPVVFSRPKTQPGNSSAVYETYGKACRDVWCFTRWLDILYGGGGRLWQNLGVMLHLRQVGAKGGRAEICTSLLLSVQHIPLIKKLHASLCGPSGLDRGPEQRVGTSLESGRRAEPSRKESCRLYREWIQIRRKAVGEAA